MPTPLGRNPGLDVLCKAPWDQDEYYPFPNDPTVFVECNNGVAYVRACPEGLTWNQTLMVCDYPR
ncbi:hypothetical protein P3T37_004603 [Kitasatospora sp. MAA4]|nr:hypothetical protein [Kitasatospora sp. MAA4]